MKSREFKIKAENLTLKQIRKLMKIEAKDISFPRKLQDYNVDGLVIRMNDDIAKEIGYTGEIILP